MNKLFVLVLILISTSCAEMQQVMTQLPQTIGGYGGLSNAQISGGLKEALNFGVNNGVMQLGQKDGFFKNNLVKIMLPEELQTVDKTLRNVGLGSLADQGLKLLNNAAEDAVKDTAPIFKNAITQMSFTDASNILLGSNNSATQYLQNTTSNQLVTTFEPNIKSSLSKVGADKVWKNIITKYNTLTGKNVTTDLTSYVTQKAVDGVFVMVAQKELDIRQNIQSRSTDLLKNVFALQDNK